MSSIHYDFARELLNIVLNRIEDLRERASIILGVDAVIVALMAVVLEDIIRWCAGWILMLEGCLIISSMVFLLGGAGSALYVIAEGRRIVLSVPENATILLNLNATDIIAHILGITLLALRNIEGRKISLATMLSLFLSGLGLSFLVLSAIIGIYQYLSL